MIPKDSDGFTDGDYDDFEELGWSEFDWEKYLREQDDVIHRYLGFYEQLSDHPDRIDEVAKFMGWDPESEKESASLEEESEKSPEPMDLEPYTLQRNPVFVATSAIYLSLIRSWERTATDSTMIPQGIAVPFLSSLFRGQHEALLAIQSLDLGDYTMAISLFKRALRELNNSLRILSTNIDGAHKDLERYKDGALAQLFDLREIWLRVISECREEVSRHDKKGGDEGQQN